MNDIKTAALAGPISSAFSRVLSQRVERLETLRSDAYAHRDRAKVALIERQIKSTILEWCDSFVLDIDSSASLKR